MMYNLQRWKLSCRFTTLPSPGFVFHIKSQQIIQHVLPEKTSRIIKLVSSALIFETLKLQTMIICTSAASSLMVSSHVNDKANASSRFHEY